MIVALAVLTALGLYSTFRPRLGVRYVGSQLTDLFRGNADMARQMAEIDRRLAALEGRMDASSTERGRRRSARGRVRGTWHPGRQLAETVATYETRFSEIAKPAPPPEPVRAFAPAPVPEPVPVVAATPASVDAVAPAVEPAPVVAAPAVMPAEPISAPVAATAPAPPAAPEPEPLVAAAVAASIAADEERLAIIRSAIDANRIDLYLQPIVTLPQRKVRSYEAMSRLRTETGDVLLAADFIPQAERAGLMASIDNLVVFRCVQVVRRLLLKNRDIGLFCNLSDSTLTYLVFQQLLDFLDANRAIAPSVVLEFTQSALRSAGPIESESLSALAERGYRFSLDNLQDLRIEPRELAARGFRYIKVPGKLLLDPKDTAADIHPADLSDLLGRFGIDLIAEKIESEAMVVDLLDCDVLFRTRLPVLAAPSWVRAEALQGIADRGDVIARDGGAPDDAAAPGFAARTSVDEPAANGAGSNPRTTGLAQLARSASGRI